MDISYNMFTKTIKYNLKHYNGLEILSLNNLNKSDSGLNNAKKMILNKNIRLSEIDLNHLEELDCYITNFNLICKNINLPNLKKLVLHCELQNKPVEVESVIKLFEGCNKLRKIFVKYYGKSYKVVIPNEYKFSKLEYYTKLDLLSVVYENYLEKVSYCTSHRYNTTFKEKVLKSIDEEFIDPLNDDTIFIDSEYDSVEIEDSYVDDIKKIVFPQKIADIYIERDVLKGVEKLECYYGNINIPFNEAGYDLKEIIINNEDYSSTYLAYDITDDKILEIKKNNDDKNITITLTNDTYYIIKENLESFYRYVLNDSDNFEVINYGDQIIANNDEIITIDLSNTEFFDADDNKEENDNIYIKAINKPINLVLPHMSDNQTFIINSFKNLLISEIRIDSNIINTLENCDILINLDGQNIDKIIKTDFNYYVICLTNKLIVIDSRGNIINLENLDYIHNIIKYINDKEKFINSLNVLKNKNTINDINSDDYVSLILETMNNYNLNSEQQKKLVNLFKNVTKPQINVLNKKLQIKKK